MMQRRDVTPPPDWMRFQDTLTLCLEKLVELYRDAMQEYLGDYDWSVLVKNAALGQVNEEIPHKPSLNASSKALWGKRRPCLSMIPVGLGL